MLADGCVALAFGTDGQLVFLEAHRTLAAIRAFLWLAWLLLGLITWIDAEVTEYNRTAR